VSHSSDIAAQPAADFAEDHESQISFSSFDFPKVAPVQSAIPSKTVLSKSDKLAFRLDSPP